MLLEVLRYMFRKETLTVGSKKEEVYLSLMKAEENPGEEDNVRDNNLGLHW